MRWNSIRRRTAIRPLIVASSLMAASLLVLPATADTQRAMTAEPAAATGAIDHGATNSTHRTDRLDVTVANIAGANGVIGDTSSEMDIWVGEVEVQGRKTIWVELIDGYGEVIYDAEVRKNETHLLPDGRAIVVRTVAEDRPLTAKADTERVETDARLVITRRVVDRGDRSTSVEFLEENPKKDSSAMVAVANFGNLIWNSVAAIFSSAASNVRYALSWIVNALTV